MEEFVEIGAHVAKGVGDGVYEKIYKRPIGCMKKYTLSRQTSIVRM